VNDDLQRFVRESLARGLPREAIREQLLQAGWRSDEVAAALRLYAESGFPVPVPRRRPYLNAREAFLYLVLFATLYTSAYNTGQVLFVLIEGWLPDPVQRVHDWRQLGDWLRGATAGIIIAFPIFLLMSRAIGREVAREPEKRGSAVRKWLTYLTLLIAALVIIGDLTVLVTRLLGGELAPRFLLKVLVVFLIAAAVFGHYLGDLRREERSTGPPARGVRLGARLSATAVLAVMVAGLVLSGSPRAERLRQLDAQRVDALQSITGYVQSYHALRHHLPDSLAMLLDVPIAANALALRDPASGEPYGYRMLDSLAYELCAEFQTDGARGGSRLPSADFWRHGPGRKCFRIEVAAR
jgi:hypothetical protein